MENADVPRAEAMRALTDSGNVVRVALQASWRTQPARR